MKPYLRASLCFAVIGFAACHHAPPPAPAPKVVPDDGAARARADAARRDSIAKAEADRLAAARRDSIARADAARRTRAEAERAQLTATVYFDYDTDSLTTATRAALEAKVPVLMEHKAVRIRIEGDADDRGSDEYNLALGQRRAAAVRRFLMARGIEESRFETVSYGEERPVCHEEQESCWSRNRRDDFTILTGTEALGSSER